MTKHTGMTFQDYAHDPAKFADDFVKLNEKGLPWTLSAYQRKVLALAFRWNVAGRLMIRLLLWSEVKKSGKTLLAAVLGLWWAFVTPSTEVICCANDLEQASGRVFATMAALIKHNPALKRSTTVLAAEIRVSNDTVIRAIASDYKGAAGSRHSLVIFDELWGFSSENAARLYEELTPPPTEPDAWVLVVTYAGFTGESTLLEAMYTRGLAGKRIDHDLEVYDAGEQFMFWSHTPRQPWQTPEYYAGQRVTLRPNTYARLHENRWVTAESTFITADLWDSCVVPGLSPVLADPELSVFVGVDAALKHDTACVTSVAWSGAKLRLVTHKVWTPTAADPLDLEATIEAEIKSLRERFRVRRVVADPWQMARSVATLKAAGVPIEDFPQTVPNLTAMGENLYDLLKFQNLEIYADADLRQQALNTIALESARGWRIAKDRPGKKIDAIVALGMAALAATAAGPSRPLAIFEVGSSLPAKSKDDEQAENDLEYAERVRQAERDLLDRVMRNGGSAFPNDW